MPVELNDLLSNKRWVDVSVMGATLQVAYRPGATSLKRQAQLQREMRELQKAAAGEVDEEEVILRTGRIFCEIVCDWDLTRGGVPIPISAEEVIGLPGVIVNAVMEAVQADGQRIADEKSIERDLRRWLTTNGQLGSCPEWYPILRAAKYLGVAAWELAEQPTLWIEWALIAESVEHGAQQGK